MHSAIDPQWIPSRPALRSAGGIVAAQNLRAAEVGAQVLRDGGNAIDAAAATAFALSACEPWMSGLGGGGYMVIWMAAERKFHAIDFGMVAPVGLDTADYPLGGNPAGDIVFGWPGVVEDRNLLGPLSIAVPGQVDGVGLALEKFGTQSLAQVLAGAIALADRGLGVDWYATLLIALGAGGLSRFPGSSAVWLPNGLPPTPGWDGPVKPLPLGALPGTLRTIAAKGRRAFYEGPLSELIVSDLRALGSKISHADMQRYHARIVEPLLAKHGGSTIATVNGLTAGSSLIRCLKELGSLKQQTTPDATTYCAYAEILQSAYGERLASMGDSDQHRSPSCTSHISVIDRDGNMVSLTQTLVSLFGSKVVLPRTGMLMNNSIMTFDPRPGRPNSIGPGKRPLANMCPVLGVKDGKAFFSLGSAGGRRILPAVLQITDFMTRFDMPLQAAFDQPRIDASGADLVTVDPRLSPSVRAALASRFDTAETPRMIYPLIYSCPSAAAFNGDGSTSGVSETMHPWAAAVAEKECQP